MKLLVITHNNNANSGANRSLLSLLDLWKDSNQITVVTNTSQGELPVILRDKGINVLSVPYFWSYVPGRGSKFRNFIIFVRGYLRLFVNILACIRLYANLRNKDFDILYTNTSVVTLGSILSKIMNIPHIWHIREFRDKDFGLKKLLPQSYYIECYSSAHQLITVSDALKMYYQEFLPDAKIETVYNGFDVDRLSSRKNNLSRSGRVNVLIAGQLSKQKGQDQAIRAVHIINETSCLSEPVHLYIAGSGDSDYLDSVLAETNYPSYVHVLGQVADMKALRNEMNCSLVCSASEAFGRVIIESMLHCLPVIGSDAAGSAELIKDGVTGLTYHYGDYINLAHAICQLQQNTELEHKIIENGYLFAKEFTIQKTAKKLMTIFEQYKSR